MLVVSDGRGLFLEGKDKVTAAVQAARSANVFVIFVVLDNPNSRVRAVSIHVDVVAFCVGLPVDNCPRAHHRFRMHL